MKNRIITVQGAQIGITTWHEQDNISLTDMAKSQHWMPSGAICSQLDAVLLMDNRRVGD